MANANLKRTISRLGYALITATDDTTGAPTYGTVTWLVSTEAGGREYSASPTGGATSIWADGKEVYATEENQGYDLMLTTLAVTDDIEEDWYKAIVSQSGTVEEYGGDIEYPRMALLIVEDTTNGVGKTTIFYNAHITQRSSLAGKTSEGTGLDPQFPEHNFACRPRMDCGCVRAELQGKALITSIPEPTMVTPHILIDPAAAAIAIDEELQLTIRHQYPEEAEVTWTSSAGTIASVTSGGKVKGLTAGTSTITASITSGGNNYTSTCAITVKPAG